jgi:hypothetical protein
MMLTGLRPTAAPTARIGAAHLAGHVPVAVGEPCRNALQGSPDLSLEGAACTQIERNIKAIGVAIKVALQLPLGFNQDRVVWVCGPTLEPVGVGQVPLIVEPQSGKALFGGAHVYGSKWR